MSPLARRNVNKIQLTSMEISFRSSFRLLWFFFVCYIYTHDSEFDDLFSEDIWPYGWGLDSFPYELKRCVGFFLLLLRLAFEMCQIMQSLALRTTLPTWIFTGYIWPVNMIISFLAILLFHEYGKREREWNNKDLDFNRSHADQKSNWIETLFYSFWSSCRNKTRLISCYNFNYKKVAR